MSTFLQWATPIAISCIITTAIGFFIKKFLEKYFRKKEEEDAKTKEAEKIIANAEAEKRAELLKSAIEAAINSAINDTNGSIDEIHVDIKDIKVGLELNHKATVTSLRSMMKTLRDRYIQQGYADTGDKGTWNELYEDYAEMGGNHFKQWVDIWKEEVNSLPSALPNSAKE